MQIAQTKGLEAFLIWAIANSATLALFGFLYHKKFLNPLVLDKPVVKIFTNLIQIFCLIIQLKILDETLLNFMDPIPAYLIASGMGLILTLWMFSEGLKASIFTDLWQGLITLICLSVMTFLCLGTEVTPSPTSSMSDISWGIWSALILLSGIMTDLQHWQRAEVDTTKKAFFYASGLFALYLALIYTLSLYKFDFTLNLLLLVTVVGVTTSTIDSIAVALHRDFGRKLGTLIGLSICVGYGLLLELSVLSIWSYFGVIRVGLALYILYWCYKHETNSRTINNCIS
jgi:hypothetical protein